MKLRKAIIGVEKGLKRNIGANLDLADIETRWDAICQFVHNADKYGVDLIVKYDLAVINRIREQQRPLPTVYQVSTHTGSADKKVKLNFNKKCTLFELEEQVDFIAHQTYQNLQAKFFFDKANELAKVTYHNQTETNCAYFNRQTDWGEKVIDLRQKQKNCADATERVR